MSRNSLFGQNLFNKCNKCLSMVKKLSFLFFFPAWGVTKLFGGPIRAGSSWLDLHKLIWTWPNSWGSGFTILTCSTNGLDQISLFGPIIWPNLTSCIVTVISWTHYLIRVIFGWKFSTQLINELGPGWFSTRYNPLVREFLKRELWDLK